MDFTKKRVLRRVLRRGSEKRVSRRCLERPLVEYAPLGVRPTKFIRKFRISASAFLRVSEVSKRGWREGVGDQQRPKYSEKYPPSLCSPTPKGA